MSESLVPNIELKKYHDKEKELKRLREMNCVMATENEKLREEVKKWVQQAVNTQRDLDEAKRKLLELEKENDSLNTEAIQVRKKNKRLLRNIANLHEEIEAKKTAIEIEVLQHSIKEYKSQLIEAKSKNRFLQKVVNNSESQLLICHKARKVVTDDYAQLIENIKNVDRFHDMEGRVQDIEA
uniref:Glial fibrillary acidic protein-like n=1 Tax=Cucumis melo TaxID=3656 RepID=A0A9I9EB26_CUCME